MARKIPETITEAELLVIIKNTKNIKHRLAFLLGFYEAMRISEVTKLKIEDVDFSRSLIIVRQAKGSKDRHIPLNPLLRRIIKNLPIGVKDRALQMSIKKKAMKYLNKDIHFHTLRHCLSEDTELLTIDGWKNVYQLEKKDKIYSYNLDKRQIEEDCIIDLVRYKFDGKLNQIKNKHLDCLFTDEHKFIIKKRESKENNSRWGEWKLKPFNEFNTTQFKILLSGNKIDGKSIGKEKAELLGWILSDGTIMKRKQRDGRYSGKYGIKISQSLSANPVKCERIKKLLDVIGISYSSTKWKGNNNFNGKLYEMIDFMPVQKDMLWIFDWINHDRTPKWKLLTLKKEELESVYNGLMLGDGSRDNEYCSQNKQRIDFLAALSHLIGKRVMIGRGILNMGKKKGQPKFRTFVTKRNDCQIDKKDIIKVDYNGLVWCPVTFNNTWIARRKDKIFITGNSGTTYYLSVKKWDVTYVQQLLGHSKIDTTMIYTHINPTHLVDKMNEDFNYVPDKTN